MKKFLLIVLSMTSVYAFGSDKIDQNSYPELYKVLSKTDYINDWNNCKNKTYTSIVSFIIRKSGITKKATFDAVRNELEGLKKLSGAFESNHKAWLDKYAESLEK